MIKKDSCFVIMPFNDKFNGYYLKLIKPVVESKGYICERADELYTSRAIITDIFEKIENSTLVIADVTERNPNVAYELGLAHALNKPVIIISQSVDDIPFDYKHIRTCIYDTRDVDWTDNLKGELSKYIDSVKIWPKKSLVHTFTNDFSAEKQNLIKHLNSIYNQYNYTLFFDNEFYIKNEKTTLLKRVYTIIPKTNMLHFYQIFRVAESGNFKLIKIQDPDTFNQLEYILHNKTDKELSFIILTKNLEEIGKSFRIEVQLEIDNYFDNLFESGKSEVAIHPLSRSKANYQLIKEKIYFPLEEKYSNYQIEVLNHPNTSLIGSLIKSKKSDKHYVLEVNFENENKTPFRNSISYNINFKKN